MDESFAQPARTPASARGWRYGWRRAVRATALVAAAALLAGAAVVGGRRLLGRPAAPLPPPVPAGLATVARTDVVARQEADAVLGYADRRTVEAVAGGVLTAVPRPQAKVRRGGTLYEVDGQPVRLLYGGRPAWRGFGLGMPDGPDVRELEQNLVALGAGSGLLVDEHFSAATAAAVRVWQRALGAPGTGSLPAGSVSFLPGPVRVAAADAAPGAVLQPGAPVLKASSTRRVVTATVDLVTAAGIAPGQRATVVLPGAATVAGTVAAASPVLAPAPGQGGDRSGQSGGGADQPAAAVTVTVAIDGRLPAVGGGAGSADALDQLPVRLAVTTAVRHRVLAVPIAALLARPGGGYEVAVVAGGVRRRVPVTVGLFDDTASVVEVAGPGLAAGARVEVPAG